MDGCAVGRELKARPETAGCRLVALTQWGRRDVQRTRDAGFDLHLTSGQIPTPSFICLRSSRRESVLALRSAGSGADQGAFATS